MKILFGYHNYGGDSHTRVESWLSRMRARGYEIDGFVLTLDPPGPRLSWPELDYQWRSGKRLLLDMYERLVKQLDGYDVFINGPGINLHPEFVSTLSTFNVYGCFDDPESSEDLSRPVVNAYDLAMIGNIAEVDTYKSWGVKNVAFWPLCFFQSDCSSLVNEDEILYGNRDVDISILCERESGYRAQRLNIFSDAFPQGLYYGKGWPMGFLPEDQRLDLLARTKVGPNFHNSTGPINLRTYSLPANGVLQICDNRSHLSKIYRLNEEVVGFDSVKEAIDLCRYYLAHDNDRREIALAGWKRAHESYNEVKFLEIVIDNIKLVMNSDSFEKKDTQSFPAISKKYKVNRLFTYILYTKYFFKRCIRKLLKITNGQ